LNSVYTLCVLSVTNPNSTNKRSIDEAVEAVLADAFSGIGAWIVILPLGLFLGGFSFIEPWLILTPLVFFATGVLRGRSDGNLLLKGVSMSAGSVLLLAFVARDFLSFGLGLLLTVAPSTGGVALRRLLSVQKDAAR
jgi:hypothetical protein